MFYNVFFPHVVRLFEIRNLGVDIVKELALCRKCLTKEQSAINIKDKERKVLLLSSVSLVDQH